MVGRYRGEANASVVKNLCRVKAGLRIRSHRKNASIGSLATRRAEENCQPEAFARGVVSCGRRKVGRSVAPMGMVRRSSVVALGRAEDKLDQWGSSSAFRGRSRDNLAFPGATANTPLNWFVLGSGSGMVDA